MSDEKPQTESEGSIGQSVSTGGLARRIVYHWNQAVKETGDGTYAIIITKFAERIASDEREACAQLAIDWRRDNILPACCDEAQQAAAIEIAQFIRMRSNVELTGAARHGQQTKPQETEK